MAFLRRQWIFPIISNLIDTRFAHYLHANCVQGEQPDFLGLLKVIEKNWKNTEAYNLLTKNRFHWMLILII